MAVAAREPIAFRHDAVAEIDAADLVVRLVDDHDLLGPLMDLHRIAAGAEHRAGHAGAEAEAAGRVAGRLDERSIPGDLLLRLRRSGAAAARRHVRPPAWPGLGIGRPDAGEVRLLRPDATGALPP